MAAFADSLHVGQKAHLDRLQSLALAFRAASARRIEREAARRESAHARLVSLRITPADRIPESAVGRGTRTRRPADRRLIDLEHPLEGLPAGKLAAPEKLHGLATACFPDELAQIHIEHVAREGALATTRHPGDHGEPLEGNAGTDVLEIVPSRTRDD